MARGERGGGGRWWGVTSRTRRIRHGHASELTRQYSSVRYCSPDFYVSPLHGPPHIWMRRVRCCCADSLYNPLCGSNGSGAYGNSNRCYYPTSCPPLLRYPLPFAGQTTWPHIYRTDPRMVFFYIKFLLSFTGEKTSRKAKNSCSLRLKTKYKNGNGWMEKRFTE